MTFLCGRLAMNLARKRISPSSYVFRRSRSTMGDPVEHATGLKKRELLAKMGGNDNPFDLKVIKRGAGTRHNPTEIPSAFDERLIGCICDEECHNMAWMWLHKGEPKRCECGHWYSLVHKAPV